MDGFRLRHVPPQHACNTSWVRCSRKFPIFCAVLFLCKVYFNSRNPAVRPTLLRVLLCCTAPLQHPWRVCSVTAKADSLLSQWERERERQATRSSPAAVEILEYRLTLCSRIPRPSLWPFPFSFLRRRHLEGKVPFQITFTAPEAQLAATEY